MGRPWECWRMAVISNWTLPDFNMSQSVISRLCHHHQQTGNVIDLPHSGHPHSTQPQDHLLVTNALRLNPESNLTAAAAFPATGVPVTSQTVRNRLHLAWLCVHHRNIVLPLSANHCQERRVWCWPCQRWTGARGSNVIFSQHSNLVLNFHDGWQRGLASSWRVLPAFSHDHPWRYGGGSVMVGGGITVTGRKELHICHGNVTGL